MTQTHFFTPADQHRHQASLAKLKIPDWLKFLNLLKTLHKDAIADVIEVHHPQPEPDYVYTIDDLSASSPLQVSLLGAYALSHGFWVQLNPRKCWLNEALSIASDRTRNWLTEWFTEDMGIELELADLLYCHQFIRAHNTRMTTQNAVILMGEILDAAFTAQRSAAKPGQLPVLDQIIKLEDIYLES